MRFKPVRLAVVVRGDRLTGAALQGDRVETFVVDAENPATALRAELDARGLGARTVALGLPRSAVTVKPIELPPIGGDLREMVRFELERHLPFPADDAPFDVLPLPAGDGERLAENTCVLIAAADRRVVDTAVRIAQEARLRPLSLTVAAHELLALVDVPRARRIVWLHRSGPTADLLLLAGGTLRLSRSIAAEDEAAIAEEIRRSLAVARWRALDVLWVSGDAAPPGQSAGGALTGLGAPVTAPPYTSRARRRLATLEAEPRGELELAVAVASGRWARPLDLLPVALRPRRITRGQAVTAGACAVTALLMIAALLAPGYRESRRLTAINAELARLDPEVRAVERVLRELERKRRLLSTIDSFESTAIRPLPVLRELTELLPNDAWLTTLSLEGKGVELTGQAAAASALIPLLENSPRLERVEFASPVTRGRDREQFRIRAAWESGGQGRPVAAAPAAPPAPAPGAPGRP